MGQRGPIGIVSNVIISARPRGNPSSKVCASLGSVTFIKNTGPEPSDLAYHWSILPANWRRSVSRASEGIICGLFSGVALAVQLPIAKTFVVRAWAAFISAVPGTDVLSSMVIKPSLVGGWVGTFR